MKGAVFDLDGTLVDSMHVWETVDRKLLKYYGYEPDKEYLDKIATLTLTEGAQYIVRRYGIAKTTEEIKKQLTELAYEEYAFHLELKEGVKELLDKLKKQQIKLAVATSCTRVMCEIFLKRTGIYHYFDTLVFSEEIGSNKTQPDIYIETAARLGLLPQDCYVFEDVVHAAQSAVKAGAVVIGVYDSYSACQQEKLKAVCNRYLYHFSEF